VWGVSLMVSAFPTSHQEREVENGTSQVNFFLRNCQQWSIQGTRVALPLNCSTNDRLQETKQKYKEQRMQLKWQRDSLLPSVSYGRVEKLSRQSSVLVVKKGKKISISMLVRKMRVKKVQIACDLNYTHKIEKKD